MLGYGLYLNFFVICDTPVLGDDFILGNSKKTLEISKKDQFYWVT